MANFWPSSYYAEEDLTYLDDYEYGDEAEGYEGYEYGDEPEDYEYYYDAGIRDELDESLEAVLAPYLYEMPTPTPSSGNFADRHRKSFQPAIKNNLKLENQLTKWMGPKGKIKVENVDFQSVGRKGILKLDKNSLLGSGSNGTRIYLGTFQQSVTNYEQLVAIKRIQYDTDAEYKATFREIETLQKLNHPNMTKYMFADKNDQFNLMFIALELCRGSLINLFELKKDVFERPFVLTNGAPANNWWFKKHLLLGVANGLNYIHEKGHVHRDLKPQNILVQNDETDSNMFGYKAVICDFELSKEMKPGNSKLSVSQGIVGTQGWMAKEVLDGGAQTKALDVFAYGCIVQFVLVENRENQAIHPFGSDINRDNAIMESKRFSYISTNITDMNGIFLEDSGVVRQGMPKVRYEYLGDAILADLLVGVCISGEKAIRPKASEILRHAFFSSYEDRTRVNESLFNEFKHDFQKQGLIRKMDKQWKKFGTPSLSLAVPDAWKYYISHRKATKGKMPSAELSSSLFNCVMRIIRNIQQHYKEANELAAAFGGDDESIGRYFFEGLPLAFPVIYIYHQYHTQVQQRDLKRKIHDQQISTLMSLKDAHRAL